MSQKPNKTVQKTPQIGGLKSKNTDNKKCTGAFSGRILSVGKYEGVYIMLLNRCVLKSNSRLRKIYPH